MVMPTFLEHLLLSSAMILEVGLVVLVVLVALVPSPNGYTFPDMQPRMQNYWHYPSSFHTRTQYIC